MFARPVLEDVRPSDVTSLPAVVRSTAPPQLAVGVTPAANTTTTAIQSSLHSRTSLAPPISTTTTISPATLHQPPATLGTETPPAHDDSAKPALLNTTFAEQKTTHISTSTTTSPPPPLTTTTTSSSTTTTGSTTTTTIPSSPATSHKRPPPPATTPAIRTRPPQILQANDTFIGNSSSLVNGEITQYAQTSRHNLHRRSKISHSFRRLTSTQDVEVQTESMINNYC